MGGISRTSLKEGMPEVSHISKGADSYTHDEPRKVSGERMNKGEHESWCMSVEGSFKCNIALFSGNLTPTRPLVTLITLSRTPRIGGRSRVRQRRRGWGVKLSGNKRYKGVMFNVINVTRGWVGDRFPGKSIT